VKLPPKNQEQITQNMLSEAKAGLIQEAFLKTGGNISYRLLEVTGAALINYEILGNTDRALHAHIVPRYANEADEQRRKPIWFSNLANAPKLNPKCDKELMDKMARTIQKRLSAIVKL
jgi:diadenosine tetraphosphate (Ap4A) HIT family hydrolase